MFKRLGSSSLIITLSQLNFRVLAEGSVRYVLREYE
jgi:hypothetical protein